MGGEIIGIFLGQLVIYPYLCAVISREVAKFVNSYIHKSLLMKKKSGITPFLMAEAFGLRLCFIVLAAVLLAT